MTEVLTTGELASLLKVHVWTIRSWWHKGVLPEPLLPSPRCPRWQTADIDAWIRGGCKPAQLKAYKRKR